MTATLEGVVRGSMVIGQVVCREMASRIRASRTKEGGRPVLSSLLGGNDELLVPSGLLTGNDGPALLTVGGAEVIVGRAAPPPVAGNRTGMVGSGSSVNCRAMSAFQVSGSQRSSHARSTSGEPRVMGMMVSGRGHGARREPSVNWRIGINVAQYMEARARSVERQRPWKNTSRVTPVGV